MKNRNFKGSNLVSTAVTDEKNDSGDEKDDAKLDMMFGGVEVNAKPTAEGTDEIAEFKKTNVGMLRVPFDTKVNWNWVNFFSRFVFLMWFVAVMVKLVTTRYEWANTKQRETF